MADAALVAALCEEATCPVCLEYFTEPVTLDCGHNFCRACLSRYGEAFGPAATCPQCREVILRRDLRPNRQLANVIEIVKKLEAGKRAERGARRGLCERRREPLERFCREDEALVRVGRDRAREYRDRRVAPVEEAAPKCKQNTQLKSLEKEREDLVDQKLAEELRNQECLTPLEAEKQRITFASERMHTFLQGKEHLGLVHLRCLVTQLKERNGEHFSRLSEKISRLSHLLRSTVPAEFLQEVGSTFHRYEEVEERQVVECSPGLEARLRFSPQEHSALPEAIENCQVNVTLDPDTANPFLVLSEDLKIVRRGNKCQDLPDTAQRFDIMMCVLGQERFTSGRHWWEVEVEENLGRWAMGVARESVQRKGLVPVSPDQGLWAMGQSFSYSSSPCHILAFTSPESTPLTLRQKLRKIRVSLDYGKGCVEFLDGDTNDLIFAFLSASFSGEGIRPFFRVWKGAKLKC